jgi:putative hemolysin
LTSKPQEAGPGAHTVAGLVLAQLGHIPAPGEKTTWEGLTLEVVDMDGARVDKVLAYIQQSRPQDPTT